MSNVRRPMKREDTRFHSAVVPRAVAAAAGSQQKRVEHHPWRSARAVRALPAGEPSRHPSRSVATPAEVLQLHAVFAAATCAPPPTVPLRSWPREAPGSLHPSKVVVAARVAFAHLVTHEERGARCLLRTSRLRCGWHLRAQSPTMRTPSPVGIEHAHTGA